MGSLSEYIRKYKKCDRSNHPYWSILGIGKSFDKLIKIKDKFVSRKILPISLSYDHRIIDGAEGARFCVYLGQCLGRDFAFKLAV